MKEIQDCVLEKNRTSNVRFFRFGRLRKQPLGLRKKPNDRQMSLEDTRCYLKNKASGMKNALVYSEILTAHRITYRVGRETLT
jgi:hypothetical protein